MSGVAPLYDCGLGPPEKSYWRVRNVLGRVLGCLPGITSLYAWLGPCLFEFLKACRNNDNNNNNADDEDDFDSSKPRHIHLKSWRVKPPGHKGPNDNDIVIRGPIGDHYEVIWPRNDEELEQWIAEINN